MGAVERKDNAAVLEDLNKVAAAKSDNFKIKVHWQPTEREGKQPWLTMDGASLSHLVNTEEWLPLLSGNLGGIFSITVYHVSDITKPLPGELHWNGTGSGRTYEPPDTSVIGTAQWNGPSKQIFPQPRDTRAGAALPTPIRNGLQFIDGQGNRAQPNANGSTNTATPGVSPGVQALELKIQALMDAQAREREAAREEKHRAELREKDREWKMELEKVKASVALAQTPKAPERSFIDHLPALATAFSPLLAAFVSMRQSDAAAERQRESERIAREDKEREERRRTDAELRAKELAFQNQIFAQMTADKDKSNAAYKDMAEVTTKISRVAIENAHAMMDMQSQGAPPSQTAEIIQALSGPLTNITKVWLSSKTPPAPAAPPPVLPAALRPAALAGAVPNAQETAPAPRPAPIQRTREEVEAAPCKIEDEKIDPFTIVMEMLKNNEPPYFPAKVIIENIMHPHVLADLRKHGMQIEGLIEEKLGAFRRSSPENETYTRNLLVEVSVRGIKTGLFQRAQALELLVGLGISDANDILPPDAPKAKPARSATAPAPAEPVAVPVTEAVAEEEEEEEDEEDGEDEDDFDGDDEDADSSDDDEESEDDEEIEQEELTEDAQ